MSLDILYTNSSEGLNLSDSDQNTPLHEIDRKIALRLKAAIQIPELTQDEKRLKESIKSKLTTEISTASEHEIDTLSLACVKACSVAKNHSVLLRKEETGLKYTIRVCNDHVIIHTKQERTTGSFKTNNTAVLVSPDVVRTISRSKTVNGAGRAEVEREAKIQAGFNSPNIPKHHRTERHPRKKDPSKLRVTIYQEKCDTTAEKLLKSENPLAPKYTQKKLSYAVGWANGLAHMHSLDKVHADIKPDNLMTLNDKGMVIDFGLATQAGNQSPKAYFYTMAPEQENERPFRRFTKTKEADVYQFGLTLLLLLAPNSGTDIDRVNEDRSTILAGWNPTNPHEQKTKELITNMLKYNPAERPTMAQVQQELTKLETTF